MKKTPRNSGVPARTPSLRLKVRSAGVASAEIRSDGGDDDDSNALMFVMLISDSEKIFSSLKVAKTNV